MEENKSKLIVNDRGEIVDTANLNEHMDKKRKELLDKILKNPKYIEAFLDASARHGFDIRAHHQKKNLNP